MAKRKRPAKAPQSDSEGTSTDTARKPAQTVAHDTGAAGEFPLALTAEALVSLADQRFGERIAELGLERGCYYLPADDPRLDTVRELEREHKLAVRIAESQLAHAQPKLRDNPVADLLTECQHERWAVSLLDAGGCPADWQAGVGQLWKRIDAIVNSSGGTRPAQPRVSSAEEARQAINIAVEWCNRQVAKSSVPSPRAQSQRQPVPSLSGGEPELRKEGVTPRNDWFLKQYEASGTDTFHKPAMIYEKWTAMTQAERSAICPASPNKITKATVEQGIKRARKKRGT